jgi:peptide/nickel transport system permease protein
MKLYEYIIRRLILLIFVILGVTLIVFYLSHVISDPINLYLSPKNAGNLQAIAALKHKYGLDQPFPVQYWVYLQGLFTGDWGFSRLAGQEVYPAIMNRFPNTIELAIAAVILTIVVGVPLGIISGTHNGKWPDHLTRIFAIVGVSLPVFWLGLLLKIGFFYDFKVWGLPSLPNGGSYDVLLANTLHWQPNITGMPILDAVLSGSFPMFEDTLAHLVLPAITLAFISIGGITRIMRSSMLEVLRQDYITLARSKGVSERVVIYRHALKNALVPTLTISGLIFAGLLGGAPITEFIFQWPGIGQLSINGILGDDLSLVLGYVFITTIIIVIANLIIDLLYAYVDPRVRL